MTKEQRNEIICNEIDRCVKDLGIDTWACAESFSSDIFKLKDGRLAQVQITVNADVDELEEQSNAFKQ